MAFFLVVVAVGVGVVGQDAADERLDGVVRKAGYPAVDLYARHAQRLHRAGADAAADERLHAALGQELGQRLMSRAGGVHHLGRDDLAVFYVVQLEALSVSKVLEDHLFLVVCYSNLHAWPPFARPLY